MTTTDYQGGGFDLGRVVQRTFASISQNWLVFLVAAIALVGIPSLLTGFGQSMSTTVQPLAGLPFISIGWILMIIGGYVLQGTVVFTTVNGFNGKQVDIGSALTVGVRFFFPLLAVAILMWLGMVIGLILLIVPGLILLVMWAVTAPVLVAEKRGILESFQRSRDLTRGNRWMIFALFLVYGIISSIIGWTVIGLGAAMGGSLATASTVWLVALVFTPMVNTVTAVLSAAGVASIYYELRTAKEGVSPDQLASAFD
ncbi:MAG TPA: hypothetical protein VF633_09975 [Brevundimonas sp.]|jgi:hypothetical protein